MLIGVIIWRNPPPIRNIYPGSNVVDSFSNCTNGSFNAPIEYVIRGSSNVIVELLDQEGHDNMTTGLAYKPITNYQLEPMIQYHINLTRHYHQINSSCYVVTINNNPYLIAFKWRYIYRPIWEYISDLVRTNGGVNMFINTLD